MNTSDGQQYTHRKNADRSATRSVYAAFGLWQLLVMNWFSQSEGLHKCSVVGEFTRTLVIEGPSRSRSQDTL